MHCKHAPGSMQHPRMRHIDPCMRPRAADSPTVGPARLLHRPSLPPPSARQLTTERPLTRRAAASARATACLPAEPSRLYALRRALARPSARRTARWPRYSTTLWSICANMSRTVDCSQRTAATPPATRAAPELARVRERWAQVAKAACWTGASDCACLVGARADATRKATVTRAKAGRSLAGWQS